MSPSIQSRPDGLTDQLSGGTNDLLKLGASPLTRAVDVLACFGIEPGPTAASSAEGTSGRVLELLREHPAGGDELARRAGLTADEVARALVELELAGLAAVADGLYRAVGASS